MAAKVEQGDLADATAFAAGFDQTVAVVGLTGGRAAGSDAADVHAARISQVKEIAPPLQLYYVTTFRAPAPDNGFTRVDEVSESEKRGLWRESC
jgi:uncharacterized protein YbjT (DUF2867 family)